MRISIEKAAERLGELVTLAERGEEVVVMREDQPVAILKATHGVVNQNVGSIREKSERVAAIQERVRQKLDQWPNLPAAESQDFLYGDNGTPT